MRRTRARYGSRLAPGQASMLATLASIVVRRAIVRGAVRQFSLRCYARRRCRVLLAARVAMPPRARRTGAAPASEKSSAPARPQAPRPPQLTPARVCLALAVAALGSLSVAVKLAGSAYAQSLFAAFEPGLPLSVSRQTATLHAALFVFDLHCDASFSARDLLRRADMSVCSLWRCERSHVDIPRLIEGNVGLQVFTSFSQVPCAPVCAGPLPFCDPLPVGNSNASTDSITFMLPFCGFPPSALTSLLQRALHQAARMRSVEQRSGGAFSLLRSREELDAYVLRRQACLGTPQGCPFTAGLLGVEGAHALQGRLDNLDVLHAAGFRLLGLHHFTDNAAGASVHGDGGGGLTPWGARLVEEVQARGLLLDLAHSSDAVLRDVLALARKPFVVSHTGVAALCRGPGERTLSDDLLRAIAAHQGLVGIGFWSEVTCGTTVDAIADSILYVARLLGSRHVALGSDWDGGVAVPAGLDAAGVAQLTQALHTRGVEGEELQDIMGRNALRLLRQALL